MMAFRAFLTFYSDGTMWQKIWKLTEQKDN